MVNALCFLVGDETTLLKFGGKLYLADVKTYGEFNPDGHKKLLLEVITKVQPDLLVFSHSSYGWDLASHIALAIQVSLRSPRWSSRRTEPC